MHAASLVVHSAGKHFAQPLKARDGNIEFLDRRLLSDRLINVSSAFAQACNSINGMSQDYSQHHFAVKAEAERFVNRKQPPQELYYLDPPYTAQQYSRFYHILETIATGAIPNLPSGEAITSGIYTKNRYKSAFSSRKKASDALAHILSRAAKKQITVLVSYSISAAGSDGNARMIKFDELLSECCKVFGTRHVEFIELAHRYRQFNSGSNANKNRNDKEVLVLCRPA
jgi:adenine-specific DNA methylase